MRYFIHISDTHFGPTADYVYKGANAFANFQRVLSQIQSLPYPIEFTVHTGDVAGNGDFHACSNHYATAQPLLSELPGPVFYIRGNHDELPDLKNSLTGDHSLGEELGPGICFFEHCNVTGYLLDAFLTDNTEGEFPRGMLESLAEHLSTITGVAALFLHYPPSTLETPWVNNMMLLRNQEKFFSIIAPHNTAPHKHKILGIFHGHIHSPRVYFREGIPIVSAPSSLYQFKHGPSQEVIDFDLESPIGFNLVGWDEQGIHVIEQRVSA